MSDRAAALASPTTRATRTTDRLLGFALLVTAVRCTLRYVVLPFGLPLLGLAPGVATGITLVCDVLAAAIAVASLRRLWVTRHPTRWRYLALVCLVLLIVITLRVSDATRAPAA